MLSSDGGTIDAWLEPNPDEPDSSIWRYLDFTKLVSLLETRALHFSRADLLGDPYGGSTAISISGHRDRGAQLLDHEPHFFRGLLASRVGIA